MFYLSADTRQTNAQIEAITKQTSSSVTKLKKTQNQTTQLKKTNPTEELKRAQDAAGKLVEILIKNGDIDTRYRLIKQSGLLPTSTKRSDPIISTIYPSDVDIDIKVSEVTDYTAIPIMVVFTENDTATHMMTLQYDAYQKKFTEYRYYDKGSK
ncbi:hypothetical protein K1728_05880 [Weissella confusa]|uniref:hypothetical protein n=1 Tax=Weissella confusa TaxID=1583 RepID=UPI001C6F8261|nr:hypothetical protein [Weissella confusa]QYU56724.1 hypothetical protein K1728_05880 [Weissella confusa]